MIKSSLGYETSECEMRKTKESGLILVKNFLRLVKVVRSWMVCLTSVDLVTNMMISILSLELNTFLNYFT